jgi:replicative DNA helicase
MEENKDDLESKSNNEILFEIKQMEADHEALKLKMLKDYDKLVEIEKRFDKANQIILKRLKGE